MIGKRMANALLALLVILGSYKGYLALYDRGKTEPKQIFPRQIDTFPEADQLALEKGIVVRNDRDLQKILEDYLS